MRRLIPFLLLAALVAVALAAGDTRVATDSTVSLVGYTEVEIVAIDGSATVDLISGIADGDTTVVRTHYLRDSIPRQFRFMAPYDGIDSLTVYLHTASEVIVTPR